MAYNKDYYDEEGKDIIYDLRQHYANIIGGILKEISVARMLKKWSLVYELVNDNLYILVHQKLKPSEEKDYEMKLKQTQKVISENQQAFLGKSKEPNEVEAVRESIKNLEMFLLWLMERHKMFGAKEEAELI